MLVDQSGQKRHLDLKRDKDHFPSFNRAKYHPDNRLKHLLQEAGGTQTENWDGAVKVDFGVIRSCEVALENRDMVGRVRQGRMGVEFAGGEEGARFEQLVRRQQMVRVVREDCEAERMAKAFNQRVQCSWVGWTKYNQKFLSWKSLAYPDPRLWRFGLGSTYDTLSSPANLKRWHVAPDDSCYLCGERGTFNHSLSGCAVALGQGRYRYRHYNVLRVICHHLVCFLKNRPKVRPLKERYIGFVSAGTLVERQRNPTRYLKGLLFGPDDWEFLSDIGGRLVFPPHIVATGQRPDIVIFSNAHRIIIMIELTCPAEQNFEKNNKKKLIRYNNLRADCEIANWKCHLFAVEVGGRGYTAQSLTSCLRALGLRNRSLRRCLDDAGNESLRSSFWIWFLRKNDVWGKVGFSERKTPSMPIP